MPLVPDSKTPLDLYTYATTEAFRRQFERALIPYTKGDWTDAKKQMEECLSIVPDDMPALHILMDEYKFLSPPSWKGYRDAYDV